MAKTLIAYFSHTGENYFGGAIRNISKGNTAVVAEFAQKATGGDLFEIKTVKDYPVNYKECTEVAAAEGRAGERPALKGTLPNIADYDTIILGYPCWWGTMPMACYTFLEHYDTAGKKIVPFCTHEGSGMGISEKEIKKTCPKANVLSGLAIHGSGAADSESMAAAWAKKAV